MGVITSYPDDTTTSSDDKFLTSDSSGATKLTPASTVKDYMLGDGDVTTAKIADDAVTGAKIGSYYFETQTDDSNSIANATVNTGLLQGGYVQIVGDGTNSISQTVTFPEAFGSVKAPTATFIGALVSGSAGADITAFTNDATASGTVAVHVNSVTTTQMTITLKREGGSTFSSSVWWAASWIVMGTKA